MIKIYTGGAEGTDMIAEKVAEEFKFNICAYSFQWHRTDSKYRRNLSQSFLEHADSNLIKYAEHLRRTFPSKSVYTNNLLRRDYWITRDADLVVAIGYFDKSGRINGGTAWGVESAKGTTDILFFNLETNVWLEFDCEHDKFIKVNIESYFEEQHIEAIACIGASELDIKQRERVREELIFIFRHIKGD